LKKSSLAGIAASTFSLLPVLSEAEQSSGKEKTAELFELSEISITELQKKFQSGRLTSVAVTKMYLDRISKIDHAGPHLKSVLKINPDALTIAASLDAERKSGKVRGPLHGIPVLLKDNIETGDQMPTTAGSLALAENRAAHDAFIVDKLRKAGAVILGKTNLSEWANFRSTKSTSGWSSVGGQTLNPYYLDRNPLGSSSGSAVAVSANLCAVAVGTETDGSIVAPAGVNGIVGIKPTVGLISRSGIIPISNAQDSAGPMGRTVRDAAILLGILAGQDASDHATSGNSNVNVNYESFLRPDYLKGKRIGVERSLTIKNDPLHALFLSAIRKMEDAGAIIVDVELMEQFNGLDAKEFEMMKYEFKDGINRYLASTNGSVRNLASLIEFNNHHADKVMPYFKQEIFESAEQKGDLNSKEYLDDSVFILRKAQEIIRTTLQSKQLDALSGITLGPACSIDLIYGDKTGDIYFGTPSAIAGFPHITVPCGRVYDLPVGLSFCGDAYSESGLIGMAYAFEQLTMHRKPPEFQPHLNLG